MLREHNRLLAEVFALTLERDMRKMAEARNVELLNQRDDLLALLKRWDRDFDSYPADPTLVDDTKAAIATNQRGVQHGNN